MNPFKHDVLRRPLEILLGRGAAAIVSVVFVAYLARELPKGTLALVAIHQVATMIARVLLDFGLSYTILKEAGPRYAEGDERTAVESVAGGITIFRSFAALALAIVYGGVGVLFAPYLDTVFEGTNIALAAPGAALHLFLKNLQYNCTALFQAKDKLAMDSTLDSGSALAEKIPALLLFIFLGIDWFFLGLAIGQLVITLLIAYLLRDSFRFMRMTQMRWSVLKAQLVTYKPHYLRVLYRQGARQLDRVLVALLLPIENTATLHVARNASVYLQHVAKAFTDPFTVHLSRPATAKDRARHLRTTKAFAIGVPLVVSLLSPWAMWIFGGERYVDSWPVLMVLCASYVFFGLSQIQLGILTMLGDGTDNLHMDLVATLIGLAITGVGSVLFGENGMAWGQMAAFFITYIAARRYARSLWTSEIARIERETPLVTQTV